MPYVPRGILTMLRRCYNYIKCLVKVIFNGWIRIVEIIQVFANLRV